MPKENEISLIDLLTSGTTSPTVTFTATVATQQPKTVEVHWSFDSHKDPFYIVPEAFVEGVLEKISDKGSLHIVQFIKDQFEKTKIIK